MNREKIACNCENVNYGQILDAVRSGADTFEKVQEITGCSKGCGKCKELITTMVRDIILFPDDYN